MALINCPECGKEISGSAKACPSCGFPMADYKHVISEKQQAQQDAVKRQREEQQKKYRKCKECGRSIGQANICPCCGFDMTAYEKSEQNKSETTKPFP